MRLMEKPYYKGALQNLRNYRKLAQQLKMLEASAVNLQDSLTIAPPEYHDKINGRLTRVQFWIGQYRTAIGIIDRAIGALEPRERELLTRRYVDHESDKQARAAMGLNANYFRTIWESAVDHVAFALYGVDGMTPIARASYLSNKFA